VANILNWNIEVTNGLGGSFNLTSGNSALSLNGTALTTKPTGLQFNFGSGPQFGTLGNFAIVDQSSGWRYSIVECYPPPVRRTKSVGPGGIQPRASSRHVEAEILGIFLIVVRRVGVIPAVRLSCGERSPADRPSAGRIPDRSTLYLSERAQT